MIWTDDEAEPGGALRLLQDNAAKLQCEIDALRAAVIDLYGRLGYPMPNLDAPTTTEAGAAPTRAASAG